jgi:hypothetical protein
MELAAPGNFPGRAHSNLRGMVAEGQLSSHLVENIAAFRGEVLQRFDALNARCE